MNPKTFAEQFAVIKSQKILMIGFLFLFVIVIFWIGLSMFGSQTKFAVSKELRDLSKPLTPTVKDSVLSAIEQKRSFTPEELIGFTIYKVIEEKGSIAKSRLVDIGYVPPDDSVNIGTLPTAKPGGLSTFLDENPSYADATDSAQPSDISGEVVDGPSDSGSVILPDSEDPEASSASTIQPQPSSVTTQPTPTPAATP